MLEEQEAHEKLKELADLRVLPTSLEDDIKKAKPADAKLAAQACRMRQCVKKAYDDDTGLLTRIETFPWRMLTHSELGMYGCGVAVELLLHFQSEVKWSLFP